jgi:hypothetical protein
MSADSERLTPNYTERGFIEMNSIAGYDHGAVKLRESSLATVAAIWLTIEGHTTCNVTPGVQVTLNQAAALRDQLDVLIRQHRMAALFVDAEIVDEPEPVATPTWRPVRVTTDGQVLALVDEHGERMSLQSELCEHCGAHALFTGPARSLCISCGRTS